MHQTFYIDVDEEITSVIERLRKAKAHEIIMVVPKRALLIQSIVNLRLLKKEAEGNGLQLMIVTQDKLGKLLVEKAGILVQQKLDDNMDDEMTVPAKNTPSMASRPLEAAADNSGTGARDNRFEKLGSDSFFDDSAPRISEKKPTVEKNTRQTTESIVNKELVTGIGSDIRKVAKSGSVLEKKENIKLPSAEMISRDGGNISRTSNRELPQRPVSLSPAQPKDAQYDKIENFFYNNHHDESKSAGDLPKLKESFFKGRFFGKIMSAAFYALIAAAVIMLGYGAYAFIPKATINLSVKENKKTQDFQVKGDINMKNVDVENNSIPARLVSVTNEVTQTVETSGGSSSSSQKARGQITIRNEFSSSPQALVATTRFVSESGKLFRLSSGVTVPGMNNGQPGEVQATVVADEAGEDYNIEASKFTIPGFKDSGSDKYTKIYGISTQAMTGGGKNGNQIRTVSEGDIAKAKTQLSAVIEDSMVQKIKEQAGGEAVVLSEAINPEEVAYKTSATAGVVADNFQVTATKKATALVFEEDDLKSLIANSLAKSGSGKVKIDNNSLQLDYAKADVDFKGNTINVKVHAASQVSLNIDLDAFKKDILGKSNDEFESILSNYRDIEKAEINYWPPFISWRIPFYASRVDIIVNSQQ